MALPELDRNTTCCFSGYRPHKFPFDFESGKPAYNKLESDVLNAILESYKKGYRTFLCGGAMGFDLLCGEIVLMVRKQFKDIKLICMLPFEGQAENFPQNWYERYHEVLKQCDHIDYISPDFIPGCYYDRNEKMVNSSSRVITYFDGKMGGTARTIAYAQKNKLDILNICEEAPMPEQITFFTGYID